MQPARHVAATFVAIAVAAMPARAAEWSDIEITGYIEPELRYFYQNASENKQYSWYQSVAGEIEVKAFWDDGDASFTFRPFYRWDRHDDNRTHFDIREMKVEWISGNWEFRLGVDKVFWGVTEAVHLIDIINQTDLVESLDGEEKLGQPMINVTTTQDFGTFEFYVLPYFRERTFPDKRGRPRTDIVQTQNNAQYEHSDKENHTDFAVRYSHFIGDWDFGLAYFRGTGREPLFDFGFDQGDIALVPFYPQIDQVSVDVQATKGAWLYKFEGYRRRELGKFFTNMTGGIEYTFFGIFDRPDDLGVVAEFIYDDRGDERVNPFENDAFLGLRWTANDAQSTALLAGGIVDVTNGSTLFSVEAERRIGDDYLLTAEWRLFTNLDDREALKSFQDDDFLQVRLARYF